jgi:hypothetical protein
MSHDVMIDGQRYVPEVAQLSPERPGDRQLELYREVCQLNREQLLVRLASLRVLPPLDERISMASGELITRLVEERWIREVDADESGAGERPDDTAGAEVVDGPG